MTPPRHLHSLARRDLVAINRNGIAMLRRRRENRTSGVAVDRAVLVAEAARRQLALAGSGLGGLGSTCKDIVDLVDVVGMCISDSFGAGGGHWVSVAGGEEGGFGLEGMLAGLGVGEREKGEEGKGQG